MRAGGQTFLVDCGRGVLQRAAAVGVGANALTALLLTHLHSDHIADLGDVLITRWITTFDPGPPPLPIIGPPGTAEVVEATLKAFGHDIGYRIAHHADLTDAAAGRGARGAPTAWCGTATASRITVGAHRSPTRRRRPSGSASSTTARRWCWPATPCRARASTQLAAGAGALVHTVIRKDLVDAMPMQRIRDICDYHSSVEQAAETAARAGVGILVLTHYVPAHRARPGGAVAGAGRVGVQPARSNSATTCTGWRSTRASCVKPAG